MHVLDEATKLHPTEWWWLKGDGSDLVVNLGESGDVDLNDGCLQAQIDAYRKRLQSIEEIKPKETLHTHTTAREYRKSGNFRCSGIRVQSSGE